MTLGALEQDRCRDAALSLGNVVAGLRAELAGIDGCHPEALTLRFVMSATQAPV